MNGKLVCGSFALLVAASANAGVMEHFGIVERTPAPASLMPGEVESDDMVSFVTETVGFELTQPLNVDIVAEPGTTYDIQNRLNQGAFETGSVVDSYLLHLDLVGDNGNKIRNVEFEITFDTPILGLIILGDANWNGSLAGSTLDDSDYLAGDLQTAYPSNADGVNRGTLEAASNFEWLEISPDGFTLSGKFRSRANHLDQVRIITEGQAIPAPGAVALAGFAALAGVRRRR